MLRKTLSELRRASRRKRTATLVGIMLLLLGVATVAVVLAANPIMDGVRLGDSGWTGVSAATTDPDEAAISDQYDIKDVYLRSGDENLNLYGFFDVYATTGITVNQDATIAVYFDMDRDYTTGEDNPFCKASEGEPELGPERRIHYAYDGFSGQFRARSDVYVGGATPWALQSFGLGAHLNFTQDAGWETAVAYSALGLTTTQCVSVGIHFEQYDTDEDDSLCDVSWCYTDGVTVVDLSSFAASSDGSDSRVIQPGMWALLGLGLAFVAAGGLVLWRGWGLAS